MNNNNSSKKQTETRREVEALAFIILGITVTTFFLFLTAESANLFLLATLSLTDAVLLASFLMTLYFYLKPNAQAKPAPKPEKKKDVLPRVGDQYRPLFGILIIVLGLAIVVILAILETGKVLDLPFAVIFSVVATVLTLAITAVVFKQLKLTSENEALGLPKGTIRAIIAISLIVLFAIIIIFVETQLAAQWTRFDFNANVTYPNGTIVNYPNGTAILTEPTQAQKDFSLQMLTTLSTLVVAIVGFYFGTKAVQVAQGVTPTDSLDITPESPTELNISLNKAVDPIKAITSPENESVEFKVANPEDGKISRKEKLNEFRFEASEELIDQAKTLKPGEEKIVTLIFWLAKNPKTLAPLEVKIISGTQPPPSDQTKSLRISDPGNSVEISPGEERNVVLEATDKEKIVFNEDYDKALIESISKNEKGNFTLKVKADAQIGGKTTVTFRLDGTDSTAPLEITVIKASV